MKIQFDEKSINSLGTKYNTEVVLTDCANKKVLFEGELDLNFLEILDSAILEKNLPDDFKWHLYQNTDYGHAAHLIQVAINGNGHRYLKVEVTLRKKKAPANHDGQFFLWGLISGLFGMSFWETLAALFVYNEIKQRDRKE
jgi:hypothetical protein